ncbi:PTS transporter subunit EIIC [Serratia marcescens]|nr:PTS transporter subunit EIIC [Serratia marcescens]
MNYSEIANEIIIKAGGKENFHHITHCATRLRITLANPDMADKDLLKKIKGVLGVVDSAGQLQIIMGQHVGHVYSSIDEIINTENKTNDVNKENQVKKNGIMTSIIDVITGIFTPVLSAVTGAAMVKVLLILLTITDVLSKESDVYIVLNFVSDSAFYFLPIMLAYSAAQKFKMNPYVAMALAGVLMHPMLLQIKTMKGSLSFFGLDIPLVSYGATVIPVILVVWVASYVEKISEKISPNALVFFMKPFLTVLVMAPLALTLIAPLGMYIGEVLGFGINYINSNFIWLLPVIFGIFSPIFIMTGMHYAVAIPIVITSLSTYGYDMAGAGFLVANIAQGAAALAVARLAKDIEFKSVANTAGFTGLLGITEPALYGVNLKFKKPFYAVMISGGLAGLYVGVFGVKRMALTPSGLTTLPVFIDPSNSMNFVNAIIGVVLSFILSFTLTTFLMRNEVIKS